MIDRLLTLAIETPAEDVVLLRFGDRIDGAINANVHAALACLQSPPLPGVDELIPAYATLAVHYDPGFWFDPSDPTSPDERLGAAIRQRLITAQSGRSSLDRRTVDVPVCYDVDLAPDLFTAATQLGISPSELAQRHCAARYRVAMLGFAPGFPYLLGLDPGLQLPRRVQPRLRVAAGSVAIGGAQTGIYPGELPGGWHLIGRTPLRLFDPRRLPPNRLVAGDAVRFVAIDRRGYDQFSEHAK